MEKKAQDATTIAGIRPKLTPEQQQWMDQLSQRERRSVERVLREEGEAYFLKYWESLNRQLEEARTLYA